MEASSTFKFKDFKIENPDLLAFLEGRDEQELLSDLRYFAALNENPEEIIEEILNCYGLDNELDSDELRLNEFLSSFKELFKEIKEAGFIYAYHELTLTRRLLNLLGEEGFAGYLIDIGSTSDNRTIKYETLHKTTSSEQSKVFNILSENLPPNQYEMVRWAILKPNNTPRMLLTVAEEATLDVGIKNLKILLPRIADILGIIVS